MSTRFEQPNDQLGALPESAWHPQPWERAFSAEQMRAYAAQQMAAASARLEVAQRMAEALRGENGVLRGLLRAADEVLETLCDADSEDGQRLLNELRAHIGAALAHTLPQTGLGAGRAALAEWEKQ